MNQSMVGTIQGFFVRGRTMQHWGSLLQEWMLAVDRYCRQVDGDAPYIHGERPNVSLLAAAAWRAGWVALEEPATAKAGRARTGRSDLWLNAPKRPECVEAKYDHFDCSGSLPSYLAPLRDAAKQEARDVVHGPGWENQGKTAVVFACLQTLEGSQESVDDQIESAIAGLSSLKEASIAVAWVFPEGAREVREGRKQLSGVALIAEPVG